MEQQEEAVLDAAVDAGFVILPAAPEWKVDSASPLHVQAVPSDWARSQRDRI